VHIILFVFHLATLSVVPTKRPNGRMINDRGLFQGYIPAFAWTVEENHKTFSRIAGVPAEDLCLISYTVSQQK
jgi:hypothetical protein